jgi:hypothetical protein
LLGAPLTRLANLGEAKFAKEETLTRLANLGEAKFAKEETLTRLANLGEAKFAKEEFGTGVVRGTPNPSCESWRSQVRKGRIWHWGC